MKEEKKITFFMHSIHLLNLLKNSLVVFASKFSKYLLDNWILLVNIYHVHGKPHWITAWFFINDIIHTIQFKTNKINDWTSDTDAFENTTQNVRSIPMTSDSIEMYCEIFCFEFLFHVIYHFYKWLFTLINFIESVWASRVGNLLFSFDLEFLCVIYIEIIIITSLCQLDNKSIWNTNECNVYNFKKMSYSVNQIDVHAFPYFCFMISDNELLFELRACE